MISTNQIGVIRDHVNIKLTPIVSIFCCWERTGMPQLLIHYITTSTFFVGGITNGDTTTDSWQEKLAVMLTNVNSGYGPIWMDMVYIHIYYSGIILNIVWNMTMDDWSFTNMAITGDSHRPSLGWFKCSTLWRGLRVCY